MSTYEQIRAENIRRNQELLAELGVRQAVSGLREQEEAKRKARTEKRRERQEQRRGQEQERDNTPRRRSYRKAGLAPVEHEIDLDDRERSPRSPRSPRSYTRKARASASVLSGPGGFREEISTVSELNALGTCIKLYDEYDGALRRLQGQGFIQFDESCIRGRCIGLCDSCKRTLCHWHRHKTKDAKPRCSKCADYYCGPCLQNRHGENIFELLGDAVESFQFRDPMQNARLASWLCPKCRNMCNCSAVSCQRVMSHRPPTGSLAQRAVGRGYDGVSHYLVMGYFDWMVLQLEQAIAERNAVALRMLVADSRSMELHVEPDPAVVQRVALDLSANTADDLVISNGAPKLPIEKQKVKVSLDPVDMLFFKGANAKQVVDRLLALLEQAKAILAELPAAAAADSPSQSESDEHSAVQLAGNSVDLKDEPNSESNEPVKVEPGKVDRPRRAKAKPAQAKAKAKRKQRKVKAVQAPKKQKVRIREFVVESIFEHQLLEGSWFFHVRWLGYKRTTYEPLENLIEGKLVNEALLRYLDEHSEPELVALRKKIAN
jgi:hypothetical protein